MKKSFLAIITVGALAGGSLMALDPPRRGGGNGPNGKQGQGQSQGPTAGKKQGPRDGSGPIHTPGTGGGTGAGKRAGRR